MTVVFRDRIRELSLKAESMAAALESYNAGRITVLCTANDIAAGSRIMPEDVTTSAMSADSVPQGAIMQAGQCTGTARIDIPKGSYLLPGMISQSEPENDTREMAYTCIETGTHIGAGDSVDIRILYPDGTDYIVLADKEVYIDSDNPEVLLLHNGEEEILLMDSAVVDAYLYTGTLLYAARYVDPELQNEAVVNYSPSDAITDLIHNDPNIVAVASNYLSEGVRRELERRLAPEEQERTVLPFEEGTEADGYSEWEDMSGEY